jgi:hypothetical protein
MNTLNDARLVMALSEAQRGVFSTSDLQATLADRHSASFARRVRGLVQAGVLSRFLRGWYVAETFDLPTLSQRLAPESYVSFGNVLAKNLLMGTNPERQVMAAKIGRGRSYQTLGFQIVHLGLARHLHFGYEAQQGVEFADSEKAVLDVLYFHLRGQTFFFDPFSDIDFTELDPARLRRYLARYKNPKFVSFVSNVLGLS